MAKKVVLVHGLGGDQVKTWGKLRALIETDPDLDFVVMTCGYQSPTPLSFSFWRRGPSVANIAAGVLSEIGARCDLDNDTIILVGHSLGGIIVKKLLLLLHTQKTKHKIKKICFIDVPHDGSGYANVGKYMSFRNRHLKTLSRGSNELDELNAYSGPNWTPIPEQTGQ